MAEKLNAVRSEMQEHVARMASLRTQAAAERSPVSSPP
jgi:hypothetical protein